MTNDFASSRKEAVHRTGLPISAFDISPSRTHAVLAGREILKTIRVEELTCTEDFNLRSKIINYASTHDDNRDAITAGQRDQLAAVDVKWSRGNFDTTIATAAANGRIMIYDLNRSSVEISRLHEHTRQVHRIAFNPYQPAFLLSGSQDGTIRLWDLRALGGGESGGGRSVKTCNSFKRYLANGEGIRDVKWAPNDGYTFAVATENGSVQKWNLTKDNAPTLRLHAHDRSCSAIDWHPDGRYLASGSTEKLIKIWDFGSEDRRMKPINQIRAPQAVTHIQWRPNSPSIGGGSPDQGIATTQICTAYDAKDPRIHVWDLQRPNVPVLELEKYETPPSALQWHSRDLLWSAGQSGTFTQNDIKSACNPTNRHGSTLAVGSDGRIAFFSSSKSRYNFVDTPLMNHLDEKGPFTGHSSDRSHSIKDISPEEQSVEQTIHRRRQKSSELRTNTNFGSNVEDEKVDKGEEFRSQLVTSFISTQIAAIGYVPRVFDAAGFIYLAEYYVLPSYNFLIGREPDPHLCIQAAFEKNAYHAERSGDIRLSQTWKILGQITTDDLTKRAERNKKQRLMNHGQSNESKAQFKSSETDVKVSSGIGAELKKSNISTSSTPLARPIHDNSMLQTGMAESFSFSLSAISGSTDSSSPDSKQEQSVVADLTKATYQERNAVPHKSIDLVGNNKLGNHDDGISSLMASFPTFPGLEEHLEESRNALNSYRARPRKILNLEGPYGSMQDLSHVPLTLDRHDSNESFQMFSASADSDHRSFPMDNSFDERKSFSQISNGSFSSSLQPNYQKTKLDDLREDDDDDEQITPLIVEPQEPAIDDYDDDLPVIEMVTTHTTNGLISHEPIKRPSGLKQFKVHKNEFAPIVKQETEPPPDIFLSSDYTTINTEQPPNPKPWTITSLLRPLITHHTDILSDSQLPTILSIWLYNYFPKSFTRSQITNLILFYHKQLLSLSLFIPAARLRQSCTTIFPEILEHTAGSTRATIYCRTCHQTFTPDPKDTTICTRCTSGIGMCSICESHYPPPTILSTTSTASKSSSPPSLSSSQQQHQHQQPSQSPQSNLWTYCPTCAHGGHTICLNAWFQPSGPSPTPEITEGACPHPGCSHDCVAGARRENVVAQLERVLEARKMMRKGGTAGTGVGNGTGAGNGTAAGAKIVVRDDEWRVGESRAVGVVRGIVVGGAGADAGANVGDGG